MTILVVSTLAAETERLINAEITRASEVSAGIAAQYSTGDILSIIESALTSAHAAGKAEGIKEAADEIADWLKPGELQLRAGEMTAQERRTAKAILSTIAAAIRQDAG